MDLYQLGSSDKAALEVGALLAVTAASSAGDEPGTIPRRQKRLQPRLRLKVENTHGPSASLRALQEAEAQR